MPGARTEALLYDAVLGEAMNRLAAPVRDFHCAASPVRYAGRVSVVRGSNPFAALIGIVAGLPAASNDTSIEIEVGRDANGAETWRRKFGGRPFVTGQHAGSGSRAGLMIERIGPMSVAFALAERNGELHLDVRGWRYLGIPMPGFLKPRAVAFETGAGDRFNFDVAISLPLVGLLVHYRGWLLPS